jgi:methionyl-tRNA synthetase
VQSEKRKLIDLPRPAGGIERFSVNKDFKRILVTAALPYANGKIHLGHMAGAYLPADIYSRYQRSMGRDILFVCGSDEHGVPITITAEQEKTTPQAVVDRYHALNKKAFTDCGISFDNYSRTSLPLHHDTAREFFVALHKANILRSKNEKQLFDEKARMFLPDRYVEGTCPVCKNPDARGDQCEQCGTFLNPIELINPRSKITGEKPSVRETVHFYFPLGKYQSQLERYIADANERDGWKANVLNYCRSWFNAGLQDRAVTRDLQWGVKVPLEGFENKVLYVWFEAVLGYISSTKEWAHLTGKPEEWKKYWLNHSTKYVAFIGKDNVVFHCIVFPAMLMAWNENENVKYIMPENVPANEFLNYEGQKFSKSRGWGIDVDDFLSEFPADTLRYTLTMNLPESRDADFFWKDFQARTNNELADILGNFVNRTLIFAVKTYNNKVPPLGTLTPHDEEFLKRMNETHLTAGQCFEKYRFRDGTLEIMNLARFANKYFNDSEPWKMVKADPGRCATTINLCLEMVRTLAILFEPVLPNTAQKMWRMLNLADIRSSVGWSKAGELCLAEGSELGKSELLFTKIENDVIQNHIAKLPMKEMPNTPTIKADDVKPVITLDEFKKVDLRIARILAAESVPKSEKLIKMKISIGMEERQIVAGIAQHYKPDELVGRKIVVVANLQPAKLMGNESNGMLLAASNSLGKLSLLILDRDIEEGSTVK